MESPRIEELTFGVTNNQAAEKEEEKKGKKIAEMVVKGT